MTLNSQITSLYESFTNPVSDLTTLLSVSKPSKDKLKTLLEIEIYLKEQINLKKDEAIKERYKAGLRVCREEIESTKNRLYSRMHTRNANMPIDKDFNIFLESLGESPDFESVRSLAEMLVESSPPAGEAKKFSEDEKVKSKFRKQYGKNWKSVMYATAWKMYKKHIDEEIIGNPLNRFLSKEEIQEKFKERYGEAWDRIYASVGWKMLNKMNETKNSECLSQLKK